MNIDGDRIGGMKANPVHPGTGLKVYRFQNKLNYGALWANGLIDQLLELE